MRSEEKEQKMEKRLKQIIGKQRGGKKRGASKMKGGEEEVRIRREQVQDGRTDKTAQRKEKASETFGFSLSHSSEGSSQDLPPTERERERGNLSRLSTGQQLEARNNLDCSVAHSRQSETL